MEVENARVFGKEITNRAANRVLNKRKLENLKNDADCGPSKQMRRLNNYKHNNGGNASNPGNTTNTSNAGNAGKTRNVGNGRNGDFNSQQSSVSENNENSRQGSVNGVNGMHAMHGMHLSQQQMVDSENEEMDNMTSSKDTFDDNGDISLDGKENNGRMANMMRNKNGVSKNYHNNRNGSRMASMANNMGHKHDSQKNRSKNSMNNNSNTAVKRGYTSLHIRRAQMSAWDEKEIDNELWPTDYVDSIVSHLRFSELDQNDFSFNGGKDYMNNQSDITSKMRLILLDWLIEVHRKFGLVQPTLFLCVNLLDRFLSKSDIHRSKLQLAGCCAMWVASKYHEIYAPEINDFVYISDNAFSCEDLIDFEQKMLGRLGFTLTVATPLAFAQRYIKIGIWEYCINVYPNVMKLRKHMRDNKLTLNDVALEKKDVDEIRKCHRDEKIIENLVYYLIEHCLMDYHLSLLLPSKITCGCLAYTLLGTKLQKWTDTMIEETTYSLKDMLPIIQAIDKIVKNPKCKHKAVRKKYSSSNKCKVAMLQFNEFDMTKIVVK